MRKWGKDARAEEKEKARAKKEEKPKEEEKENEPKDEDVESKEKYDYLRDRADEDLTIDDYGALLINIRNADPSENIDDVIARLRSRYEYYEQELDKYDADYDELMGELSKLRNDNTSNFLSQTASVEKEQKTDIKEDGDPKDFEDLWKTREG